MITSDEIYHPDRPRWWLKGKPYEVQERAIEKAIEKSQSAGIRGFAFCMEMGLGKTATAINDWLFFGAENLIILCPNSLKSMWLEQMETWMHSDELEKYQISVAPKYPEEYRSGNKILILNYESLSVGGKKGVTEIQRFAENTEGLCHIILDESTQIKNYKAKRTKTLHRLVDHLWNAGKLHRTTILSGNPTPNGLDEFWAQLYPINGVDGISYFAFKNSFCEVGGYQGKKVIGINQSMKSYFDDLIGKRSFFALKKDWTDLPDKQYIIRKGSMGEVQEQRYNQMANEMVIFFEERAIDPDNIPFVEASWILVQMLKLRQISSGFIHDTHGDPPSIIEFENPKLDMLKADLQEVNGKAIIVVHHKFTLKVVMEMAQEMGLNPAVIGGGMHPGDLEVEKAKFNKDPDCRVIICQCASAKFGHTLLGEQAEGEFVDQTELDGDDEVEDLLQRNDACHTTIFFENDFSYEARSQMEDRNHRIGQKRKVTYIDYQLSPIDKIVREALLNKAKVHQALAAHLKTTPRGILA